MLVPKMPFAFVLEFGAWVPSTAVLVRVRGPTFCTLETVNVWGGGGGSAGASPLLYPFLDGTGS